MIELKTLDGLNEAQLREAMASMLGQFEAMRHQLAQHEQTIAEQRDKIGVRDTKIEQLTHEMALLRRWRYGQRSERLDTTQRTLFDDELDADLEAITGELETLREDDTRNEPQGKARRTPLPAHLPRQEIRHEPDSTTCACGCAMRRIGEDVAEKLNYTPGVFTVQRHIRGKWACAQCERITMAPVPAHVIDKGIPTAGLLTQVLVAKYVDHLPLYRQQSVFERAGLAIPRATLAQWVGRAGLALAPLAEALRQALLARPVLHADETPIRRLAPGTGKTHRAYLWAYASPASDASIQAVVYAFADGRSGRYARQWLGEWRGTLMVDDYTGYKALFREGVTEAGCLAHARRKFEALAANGDSVVGTTALRWFRVLYRLEREAAPMTPAERLAHRQRKSARVAARMRDWLINQRQRVPAGTSTAAAIDYSLRRWQALTRYLTDVAVPIDNNHLENRIRPIAIGRANWLFVGSTRAGERAAAVMTLVNSARLNGLDPFQYLQDVLERLPTTKARDIESLLPHRWRPSG